MSALVVNRLSLNFGGVQAVADVSLSVEPGERRLVIGPNGAGKTSLFNLISGAYRSSGGRIMLFGSDITGLAAHARARMGLSRTFQITNLFSSLTVLENVLISLLAQSGSAFSLHKAIRSDEALFRSAEALLEEWDLAGIAQKEARHISYGEKRQVDLILAMARQPRILLLDEPTAGLSAAEVVRVAAIIRALPREMTVLVIEHDMDVAFSLAERISVLNQGRLVAEGNVDEIRENPLVSEIYLGTD